MAVWIVLIVVSTVLLAIALLYNKLIRLRNKTENAWAVSLGEVERWKDAFRQSEILTSDDVAYSEDYHFASYAFDIGPDIPSTQYAPSSSSSDSAWSGDFGGGGGGGSW